MDQIQREKVLEKLGKIKALAERGVGVEKETAMRMYEELCIKYDISDDEAEAEVEEVAERKNDQKARSSESTCGKRSGRRKGNCQQDV